MAQGQAAAPTLKAAGTRAIDIHAHLFPQAYLDVVAAEGQRFETSVEVTAEEFAIKSPFGSNFAPIGIVDVKTRIAEMDRQGVAAQVVPLTAPMAY